MLESGQAAQSLRPHSRVSGHMSWRQQWGITSTRQYFDNSHSFNKGHLFLKQSEIREFCYRVGIMGCSDNIRQFRYSGSIPCSISVFHGRPG
jgi:hypothetical protein